MQHDIAKAPETSHAAISDVAENKEQTFGARVLSSQPFWVTIALIVLVVVMTINEPTFGTTENAANVTRNFAPIGIMAMGMTVVIITGGIDLSVGSVMGLVAIVAGLFLTWHYSWYVAFAMGMIAGNFPPTEGEVLVDGEGCHFHKPIQARAKGIEVVYQDLALADNLTAAQNVFLGRELNKGFWPFRVLDKQAMIDRSARLFDELKSETRPRDLVKKMSGGQRQAVAIARTRLSNAKLVLMDEPTAAISVRQVAQVLELIRRLKHQDVAVILISHRMPDVFAVSDRIIVMRRGAKVADKATASTSPEEITGQITGAIRAA